MNLFLEKWLDAASAYVRAPADLASGQVSVLSIVPTLGMLCALAGIALALVRRERQALWMIPLLLLAAATPSVLRLTHGLVGWFGMLFAILVGAVMLLLATGVVASDASHRLPVWLLSGFAFSMLVLGSAYGFLVLTGV
jgi:heme O synthase-like polyprenyltransferase